MSDRPSSWREPDPLNIDTGTSFLSYLRKELRRYELSYNLKGIRKWYNKCACHHNRSSPGGDNSLMISVVLADYFSERQDHGTIEIEAYMENDKYRNAAKPDILIRNGITKGIRILEAVEVESRKPTRNVIVKKMRLLRKHGIESVMFGIPYSDISYKRSIEWMKDEDGKTGLPIVDSIFLVKLEKFDSFLRGKIKSKDMVEEVNEREEKSIHVPQSRLTDVTTRAVAKLRH